MNSAGNKAEGRTAANQLERLLQLMAALRNPETGCPWDNAQNFETLAPYAIEEAYEVADACARQNRADLCEELGDLLLQVVFHARMAEEEGSFCFTDVAAAINAKLIRRHPQIFGGEGGGAKRDAAAAERQWAAAKARERAEQQAAQNGGKQPAYLDSVPSRFPAVLEAAKLQREAEKIGFDWAEPLPVLDKLQEEIAELREALAAGKQAEINEEYGDTAFTLINLGRKLGADFDMSLRAANQKFRRRFGYIEQTLDKNGKNLKDAELSEMEELWQQAKQKEKPKPR